MPEKFVFEFEPGRTIIDCSIKYTANDGYSVTVEGTAAAQIYEMFKDFDKTVRKEQK